ncbi:hypothetical protein S83_035640, partial [Arachis hypogaea]
EVGNGSWDSWFLPLTEQTNIVYEKMIRIPAVLCETCPSGCLTLDCALGGGLPKGRIAEIFGPESSGKSTLALHAIAEVQ